MAADRPSRTQTGTVCVYNAAVQSVIELGLILGIRNETPCSDSDLTVIGNRDLRRLPHRHGPGDPAAAPRVLVGPGMHWQLRARFRGGGWSW